MATDNLDTTLAIDRLPPNSPEAEEAVLGSLLMDPEAMDKVSPFLDAADFYRDRNRQIYLAVAAVHARRDPVDLLTVSDELRRSGAYLQIGGLAYLNELLGVVPTALRVEHYGHLVRRAAEKRRLISLSGRIAAHAYDEANDPADSVTFVLEQLARLQAVHSSGSVLCGYERAALYQETMCRISAGVARGIPTGMRVDRCTGGVRRGGLTVIGAPTGVGKTALMGEWARTMGLNSRRVLFCTTEMSQEEINARDAAAYSGTSYQDLERMQAANDPALFGPHQRAYGGLMNHGVRVYAEGAMTTAKIRRAAAQVQASGGLDVLFVDYLQRLQDRGSSQQKRYEIVQQIAQALKSIAMDLGVAVVVAAQFGRDVREDAREPRLTDYRESGGIEHEADVALGIHRPGAYRDSASQSEAWLYVLKNRHGKSDVRYRMNWLPELARFTDDSGEAWHE